jgi:NAD(P)H-hydrate repair Nnr-like enzyme with NAD(P)H-hydrate dehydratase domain
MQTEASTPEELEMLFEDTLVLRDNQALAALFETGAVLVVGGQAPVYGGAAIAQMALQHWNAEQSYIAAPQQIIQTHTMALIITQHGINVAQRTQDGAWRYSIVVVC